MRGRSRRDFWRAWREERRRLWEEHGGGPPPWPPGPPSPDMMMEWRKFFRDEMGVNPEDHWAFGGRRFRPWQQGDDTFNPFVANLLSKGGGLLPLLVLHFLSDKPRYGNEIMDLISEWTRGQWVANPGAIYPLMGDLEDQGLIVGEWEDPEKRTVRVYRITEAGREEMIHLKAIMRPKLQEAVEVLKLFVDGLDDGEDEESTTK